MKIFIALAIALSLAACSSNNPPPPVSVNGWLIDGGAHFSAGVTLASTPGGLWQFAFPNYPNHINMITTVPVRPLTGANLQATWEEDESNPVWFWAFEPSNTCNPGSPAQVHLYFQAAGDDFSGAGVKQYYRWWSAGVSLTPAASHTFTVALDPSVWTSVLGVRGTDNSVATNYFASSKANVAQVGLVFGGGCFSGHGAAVTSGSATFKLKSFQ